MKILLALDFLIALSWATKPLMTRGMALQNPDLFEGDILRLQSVEDRNAVPYPQWRWPGGVIPFVIDKSLSSAFYTDIINNAMNHITMVTSGCIIFKARSSERNYIHIFKGQGCYSLVGMVNQGAQHLSLGNGCYDLGSILHTFMHAIGFYPEHQRSDRDDYLIIYWDNVMDGMEDQFKKMPPYLNKLFGKFDYDSVMIYGEYVFSKRPGLKTMKAKEAGVRLTGPQEKPGLSHSDAYKIKKLYGSA